MKIYITIENMSQLNFPESAWWNVSQFNLAENDEMCHINTVESDEMCHINIVQSDDICQS